MKYQEELKQAEELETQGKNLEAAKMFEDIGTKCLREEGAERQEAPRIIAKSIARYLLAGNNVKAQDLAYQVLFMKDEHPFLSLQIESAIASKTNIVRAYLVDKLPKTIDDDYKILKNIPQNRKVMKLNQEVTIKQMWELTIFGKYKQRFDLIGQSYPNPKGLINFLLSTKTGIHIIGAETSSGKAVLIVLAVTANLNPVEVVNIKST
ncbi:MAG: hypothetical protein FK733_01830 [Asgard group archaeon]|nr:hypothetical protein [Asgard group archaeon]